MHSIRCEQGSARSAGGALKASGASREVEGAHDGGWRSELNGHRREELVAIGSGKDGGSSRCPRDRVEQQHFLSREFSEMRCLTFGEDSQEDACRTGRGADDRTHGTALEGN